MAGEGLLEAAGQNFAQAGSTAIAGERAKTERQAEQSKSTLGTTQEIDNRLAVASGDKEAMKRLKETQAGQIRLELLKAKMGETKFPEGMAIYLAKRFKSRKFLKLAGQPMSNDILAAYIAHTFNTKTQKPTIKENLMITQDENGEDVITNLEDYDLHYQPKGGGKGGGGGIPQEFRSDQAFKASYEKWLATVNDPVKMKRLESTDPEQAKIMKQKLVDYRDQYDAIIKKQATAGGGSPAPAGGESSGGQDGGVIDKDALFKDL